VFQRNDNDTCFAFRVVERHTDVEWNYQTPLETRVSAVESTSTFFGALLNKARAIPQPTFLRLGEARRLYA